MIAIDPDSPVAPYEQIRADVARRIVSGSLVVGARLPTVRRLADDLGVAVNTVARAYRELEAAGLVETRGRAGTLVSARGDPALTQLQAAAQAYAAVAHDLGVGPQQALRVVEAALPPSTPA